MKLKDTSDKLLWIVLRLILIGAIVWFIWAQNNFVVVSKYVYSTNELYKSFVGYDVVHISDIHNTSNNIVSKVKKIKPDIVILSGGYADKNGNYDKTVKIVNSLCEIAPVYYVYNFNDKGNELVNTNATCITDTKVALNSNVSDLDTFIKEVYGEKLVKKALSGDTEAVEYVQYVRDALNKTQDLTIYLSGLDTYIGVTDKEFIKNKVYEVSGTDANELNILVNGNIGNTDVICKTNIDMMFMGATFGQPYTDVNYIKGIYGNNGTQLFISGGCGNYTNAFRIMNFPEIQHIVLSDGSIKQSNPLSDFLGMFIDDVGTIFDNDGGFKEHTYTYGNSMINKTE